MIRSRERQKANIGPLTAGFFVGIYLRRSAFVSPLLEELRLVVVAVKQVLLLFAENGLSVRSSFESTQQLLGSIVRRQASQVSFIRYTNTHISHSLPISSCCVSSALHRKLFPLLRTETWRFLASHEWNSFEWSRLCTVPLSH